MKETALYSRLRPGLKKMGEIERIENVLGSGTPDVYYTIDSVPGWIETKVADRGYINFEKFQIPWYRRHLAQGHRHIFVAVLGALGDVYFYKAQDIVDAPRFLKGRWTRVAMEDLEPVVVLFDGKRDWDTLRRLLIS